MTRRLGRLRLAYVHASQIPGRAANTVQVVKMCQAFQDSGAEVTLLTPRSIASARQTAESVSSAYGLAPTLSFNLRSLPVSSVPGEMLLLGAVAAWEGRGSRAVVYTRSISAAAVAVAMGRSVAVEMHLPLSSFARRAERFRKLVDNRAFRLMVVISDQLRREYERELPALAGRIVVAHDGADAVTGKIEPAHLGGEFKVGYVGHLYPGKGMEIISALAPLCPWATFHIVGGNDNDVTLWRTRMAAVPNVSFHGHVPHARAASYIAAMDVVLAPYLKVVRGVGMPEENLAQWMSPLKIFEYMAVGRPMVVSDLPVLREVLEDGHTALLRDPDDPAAWASALHTLKGNPAMGAALGGQARQVFLGRYEWTRRARNILQALEHNE